MGIAFHIALHVHVCSGLALPSYAVFKDMMFIHVVVQEMCPIISLANICILLLSFITQCSDRNKKLHLDYLQINIIWGYSNISGVNGGHIVHAC